MEFKELKRYADKIDLAQIDLYIAQRELIEAYKEQWAEMNRIIDAGEWTEKAVFPANACGLKVDEELYVFQVDAPLPFLPNPYYWRFKEHHEEFLAAKLLVSLQLRNVIKQLNAKVISQPAALHIRHYYSDAVRLFDMDNKAKQVITNSFRGVLLEDDSSKTLPFFSEEAIRAKWNRTMIYLGPYSKRHLIETEIADKYPTVWDIWESVGGGYKTMTWIKEFENRSIGFHEDRVGKYFARLCEAQLDLIQAYEKHWAELNYLVRTGQWNEKAEYPGNAYGLRVAKDIYIFEMDMPLPFVPNPYVRRFRESLKDYFTAKWLVSAQLNDVLEQMKVIQISDPAALYIKHYYQDERLFDHDNKIKEVIINTLRRGNLIRDDNVIWLPYFSEEAIEGPRGNRTMIYIGPYHKRDYMEQECMPKYGSIRGLSETIEGSLPRKIVSTSLPVEDTKKKPQRKKTPAKRGQTKPRLPYDDNFM